MSPKVSLVWQSVLLSTSQGGAFVVTPTPCLGGPALQSGTLPRKALCAPCSLRLRCRSPLAWIFSASLSDLPSHPLFSE